MNEGLPATSQNTTSDLHLIKKAGTRSFTAASMPTSRSLRS